MSEKPYSYLFYAFVANLPLSGGHRESFYRMWKQLDKVIKENYELKKK